MDISDYILLAVALSVDCMTVSFICGIIQKSIDWKQLATMATLFGLFQTGMTLLGWGLSMNVVSFLTTWGRLCAFLLLFLLGIKTLWESFRKEEEEIFNPRNLRTLLVLSVATSIDALAVGISFTCLGIHTYNQLALPAYLIGMAAFSLSLVGKYAGVQIGRKIEPRNATRLAGLIFILIGLKTIFV